MTEPRDIARTIADALPFLNDAGTERQVLDVADEHGWQVAAFTALALSVRRASMSATTIREQDAEIQRLRVALVDAATCVSAIVRRSAPSVSVRATSGLVHAVESFYEGLAPK